MKKQSNIRMIAKGITVIGYCLLVIVFTGCSDWDDHFDANTSVVETQNATLW